MSIQEKLMQDSNLAFHIRALQVDSDQLGRMAKAIKAAMPGFRSVMGSECDHAEVALAHLIEERDALAEALQNLLSCCVPTGQDRAMKQAKDALNAWRAAK